MNLVFLAIFTLFSVVSFSAILFGADPNYAEWQIVALFFLTLFFTLAGLFSIAGIAVSKMSKKPMGYGIILRRGFLLATLATSLIVLEKFFALNIGNATAILIAVVAVEMIAVSRSKGH